MTSEEAKEKDYDMTNIKGIRSLNFVIFYCSRKSLVIHQSAPLRFMLTLEVTIIGRA
jgi:hypothetical protein